ncbi:MAG: hypothetical protein E6Q58_04285 [Niabella sp.]|nr:MAG: hypothetical protein E6Q58_04285 [Niabella sp.]
MKTKFLLFIAVFVFPLFSLLLTPTVTLAHPLDTTDAYVYVGKELDNQDMPKNQISIYFYMNWFQAASILKDKKNIEAKDIYELAEHKDVYKDYFFDHFKLSNNGNECTGKYIDVPQTDDILPMSIGARMVFIFKCTEDVKDVQIDNDLLFQYFQYSTNNVYLQIGEMMLDKLEMNSYYKIAKFSFDGEKITVDKPSNLISTNGSLSPDDPNYNNQSFGQSVNTNNTKISQVASQKSFWNSITDFRLSTFLNVNPNNIDFRKISIWSVIGIVFMLGFLHTIEAGHSKVILTSAILHKNMSLKRGLIYALIFTLTHISDIIIVGLIFLFLNNFVDVFAKFSLLEKFAAYALLFIAVYLLFKNITEYIKTKSEQKKHAHDHTHGHAHDHLHDHHSHEHGHEHVSALGFEHTHDGSTHSHDFDDKKSFTEQLWIGFLSGLAPCVFGWSIFMLILSTKNLWILIPAILSFGVGIFVALSLVVFLAGKFKEKLYGRYSFIMDISPILSALILLAYALYIV